MSKRTDHLKYKCGKSLLIWRDYIVIAELSASIENFGEQNPVSLSLKRYMIDLNCLILTPTIMSIFGLLLKNSCMVYEYTSHK